MMIFFSSYFSTNFLVKRFVYNFLLKIISFSFVFLTILFSAQVISPEKDSVASSITDQSVAIYVFEATTIFNQEALSNAKIVKIENLESDKKIKKFVVAKKTFLKIKKAQIKFSERKSVYVYTRPYEKNNFFNGFFFTISTCYTNIIYFFSKALIDKVIIKTKYIESKSNQYFKDFDFSTISFHTQFSVRPPPFV